MRIRAALAASVTCASLVGLGGCLSDPYAESSAALRSWLNLVAAGHPAACDLMDRASFFDYGRGGAGPESELPSDECADQILWLRDQGIGRDVGEVTVSAWDPSGEAMIDVESPTTTHTFSMAEQSEGWVVAGWAS